MTEKEAENQVELEEEEQDEEHPMNVLADQLSEIDRQLKRCHAKRPTDLKSELAFNLYPILKTAFSAVFACLEYLHDRDEEQQAAGELMGEVERIRSMCSVIVDFEQRFLATTEGEEEEGRVSELVKWAKEVVGDEEEEIGDGEKS